MAGIDQQAAELSRVLSQMTSQMSQASTQMNVATMTMVDALRKMGKSSSVQADTFDRGMSKFIRGLGTELDKASDLINDTKLEQSVNRERELFSRRLDNQSFFFKQEWQLDSADLRQQAEQLKDNELAHKRKMKDIERQITDEEKERSKLTDMQKERLRQLEAQEGVIANTRSRVVAQQQAVENARIAFSVAGSKGTQDEIEATAALAKLAEEEYEGAQKQLKEEQRLYDEQLRAIKEHNDGIVDINKRVAGLADQLPGIQASLNETQIALTDTVAEFKSVDVKAAVGRMFDQIGDTIQIASHFGIVMGIQGMFSQIQTGLSRSVGLLDVSQQAQVSQMNMSPTEFMEMAGEYRRGMLAAGGMTESLNTLSATAQQLDGNVASRAEAAKFAAQQMEMFANMGVRPTTERVRQMGETFKSVHAVTGMTIQEFNTSMRDMMEDEESMHQMRLASSETERIAIADSVAARYRENRLRGISDEQTRAMMKKQMEMQNQKPKSRFQQAVRQAALAGAMGIGGGDEMIQLAMKPASALTDEERARYQEFQDQLSRGVHAGLGSSSFGTQLYTEALADKTNYDVREMAVFNTRQAQDALGNPQANVDTFGQIGEIGQTINEAVERAAGVLKNPIVQFVGGVALLVPAMIGHSIAMAAHTAALLASSGGLSSLFDRFKRGGGQGPRSPGGGGLNFPPIDGDGGPERDGRAPGGKGRLGQVASRAGGTIMNAGRAAAGMLGGVTLGGVAAAGAAGAGVLGAGQALVGEDGVLRGGSGNNFVNDVVEGLVQKATGDPGQTLGGLIYDWMNPPQATNEIAAMVSRVQQPANATAVSQQQQSAADPVAPARIVEPSPQRDEKVSEDERKENQTEQQRLSIAQTIDNQIKHLSVATEANNYLKTVADNVPTLVDLANRQLVAMTLTDREKQRNRDSIRKSSGLAAATFQYL